MLHRLLLILFKYYEELQSLRTVSEFEIYCPEFKYYEELQSLRTRLHNGRILCWFKYYEELQSLRTVTKIIT